MFKIAFILGSVALILSVAACSKDNLDLSPTPTIALPDAQPNADWNRVIVPGWFAQPSFSIQLPEAWVFRESQGIDSYVGGFVGRDMTMSLDYGGLAGGANPRDYPQDRYLLEYEDIAGEEAILILSKGETTGKQSIMSIPDFQGRTSLNIYANNLTLEQQRTAFAIFRSVKGLAGVLKLNINLHPNGIIIELGAAIPNVVVEVFSPEGKTQVGERRLDADYLPDGGWDLHQTGEYEFWLNPGIYEIDIHFLEGIVSGDFPKRFVIETDEIVEEEININLDRAD